MRILVVEDEKRLARTIGDLLEANNYTVDLCYDGESGLDNAMSAIYDAMILDVMLPRMDGLTVARKLRQASEELLACLRALTRKQGASALDNTLTFGDLRLELSSCLLVCGERSVRLSRKEFEIMGLLMANGGQVVTKEALILKVWGYESDAEDNNVEVYISFLRRKLEHLHSAVKIRTHRLVGYCLEVGA